MKRISKNWASPQEIVEKTATEEGLFESAEKGVESLDSAPDSVTNIDPLEAMIADMSSKAKLNSSESIRVEKESFQANIPEGEEETETEQAEAGESPETEIEPEGEAAGFSQAFKTAKKKTFKEYDGYFNSDKISELIWTTWSELKQYIYPYLNKKLSGFTEQDFKEIAAVQVKYYRLKDEGLKHEDILFEFSPHETMLYNWGNKLKNFEISLKYPEETLKEIINAFAREVVDKWSVPEVIEGNSWFLLFLAAEGQHGGAQLAGLVYEKRMKKTV